MPKKERPMSHEEFEALQRKLHIEIISIRGEIIFGDILWRDERVGQIQLFRTPRLRRVIRRLREKGLPVRFDDLVRNR